MKNIITVLCVMLAYAMYGQKDYVSLGIDLSAEFELTGLAEGEIAPDFTSFDHNDNKINLYAKLKEGPVVLVFYRGYWCPKCSRHLEQFEAELFKLKEKGIQVFAITPETQEFALKTIDKTSLSVPVISDRDQSIMVDYKVAFSVTEDYQNRIEKSRKMSIAEFNGAEEAVLPVPATYLIGMDKKIQYVHFDPNYSNRASVSDILDHSGS